MKPQHKPYFIYPPVIAISLYYSVIGYMVPEIRKTLIISLTQAGLISSAQSIGIAVSVMLCFCLFSAFNKTKIMAAASFLFALGMIILGSCSTIYLIYALCFLIGIFSNIVDVMSNAIIADISPDRKIFHIGLLQALFSAAGAAAPYLAMFLGEKYPVVFRSLGIFAMLVSFIFLFGLWDEAKKPTLLARHHIGTTGKLISTLRKKGIKLIVAVNFFNSFSQISIIFFISSYVSRLTGNSSDGALALCMLFVGCILGRLVYVKLSRKISTYRIMSFANITALAAFIMMLFSQDALAAGVFACIGGMGFSVNFPGLVVEACNIVRKDTAAATSLIFIGYAAACLIAPPVIGSIGDAWGLRPGLILSAAMLIPVVIISFVMQKTLPKANANVLIDESL
ncbi:MAG: MFS transporter [Christensenellales bacterium]|jgi:fucose permease